MSNPTLEPPRFATSLLRACCSPDRLEEIEGDLCELFARRVAREGLARARRRYAVEVCSICLGQVAARGRRALRGSVTGAVEFHPLRTIVALALLAALLMLSDQPWAVVASQALLAAYGLLEVTIYAGGLYSTFKRWRARVKH